jgi:hypothetical protein
VFTCQLIDDSVSPLLAQSCKSFLGYAQSAQNIPQWHVIAFWYASFFAHYDVSVIDSKGILDHWIDLVYSAIYWLYSHPDKPKPTAIGGQEWAGDKLDKMCYWGHRSDLRHAGIPIALVSEKITKNKIAWDAIGHVCKNDFYHAPSNCQPYGSSANEWVKWHNIVNGKMDYAETEANE